MKKIKNFFIKAKYLDKMELTKTCQSIKLGGWHGKIYKF
jgi:hypothetical protein